jgi:hypothetical protein
MSANIRGSGWAMRCWACFLDRTQQADPVSVQLAAWCTIFSQTGHRRSVQILMESIDGIEDEEVFEAQTANAAAGTHSGSRGCCGA